MMNARKIMIVSAALACVLGQTPAFAQASQSDCVARDGQSGTWRKNPQDKWVRCKPSNAGSGVNTALVVGGVVAAIAIGAIGIGAGDGNTPSPTSP